MKRKTLSLYELQKDVREEVREYFEHDPDAEPSDVAHEVADSHMPVYTHDFMQLAADNICLATDAPELEPAFSGRPTPVNIIASNIYERLLDAAREVIHERGEASLLPMR